MFGKDRQSQQPAGAPVVLPTSTKRSLRGSSTAASTSFLMATIMLCVPGRTPCMGGSAARKSSHRAAAHIVVSNGTVGHTRGLCMCPRGLLLLQPFFRAISNLAHQPALAPDVHAHTGDSSVHPSTHACALPSTPCAPA